jgi:hypothetical protein
LFSFSVCRFAFGLLLSLCFLCGTEVVTDVKLVWLGWMVYLPIADLCCGGKGMSKHVEALTISKHIRQILMNVLIMMRVV